MVWPNKYTFLKIQCSLCYDSIFLTMIARTPGGRFQHQLANTIDALYLHRLVLRLHDVAALRHRCDRTLARIAAGRLHRRHRERSTNATARICGDREFDTVGNVDDLPVAWLDDSNAIRFVFCQCIVVSHSPTFTHESASDDAIGLWLVTRPAMETSHRIANVTPSDDIVRDFHTYLNRQMDELEL